MRDYCKEKPVLLEKKRTHLHREKLYRQQLVREGASYVENLSKIPFGDFFWAFKRFFETFRVK